MQQAAEDPDALAELREVTSVEGRSVDLGPVLDNASPEELEDRLEMLAGDPGDDSGSSDPQTTASEILADRKYREPDTPKPLKGVTDWLDRTFGGAIERFGDFIARSLPGGMVMFWLLIAILICIGAVLLAGRASGKAVREKRAPAPGAARENPERLERDADDAEKSGDLEASLRLRFRAGLLRLSQRGALPRRSSLTSDEIAQRLGSPTFDRLASTFDRVVYGRQPATADDAEEARRGWRELLQEVRA